MCNTWSPLNHELFQIANLFLIFSFLAPNSLTGLFMLRGVLALAGLFFMLWASLVICSLDTFVWNLVFTVVNVGHVLYLLYHMKPVKLMEEHDKFFVSTFEPMGVGKNVYFPLVQGGRTRFLARGTEYCREDSHNFEDISVLVWGSCHVTKGGNVIGQVKPFEFLDSPEWITSTQGAGNLSVTYEVTIVSDGAVILSWNRNTLLKTLRREPFLKHIFDSIIGQDVAKKIFKQNKAMHSNEAKSSMRGVCSTSRMAFDFETSAKVRSSTRLSITHQC